MSKYLILFCLFFYISSKYEKNGIDVSYHQGGNVDFNKVKNEGKKDFVIIRAGYGQNSEDKQFQNNYKKARNAGLNIGAYWYCYAYSASESSKEADKCLSVISGKKFEYPIYYDIEEKSILALGTNVVSEMAETFCKKLEKKGYFCGLYSSKCHFESFFSNKVKSAYTIWVAQYYNQCTYKGKYKIWQHSSSGKVSGISGNVDLDISYEDFPSIIKNKKLNNY